MFFFVLNLDLRTLGNSKYFDANWVWNFVLKWRGAWMWFLKRVTVSPNTTESLNSWCISQLRGWKQLPDEISLHTMLRFTQYELVPFRVIKCCLGNHHSLALLASSPLADVYVSSSLAFRKTLLAYYLLSLRKCLCALFMLISPAATMYSLGALSN